ncbi:phage/plasmid primase, P4 family [Nitrospirota bacterium]
MRFISEGKNGKFYRYSKRQGIWLDDAEDFIKHYIRSTYSFMEDEIRKEHNIKEIVEDVRGVHYYEGGFPEDKAYLIPFNNGVYDLDTDTFREAQPGDYFTWKLPWNYSPEAKSEYLARLIHSCVGEEDTITLYQIMAYCLFRGYPYQKFFILFGRGANGKGVFMTILDSLLGSENISHVPLGDMQGNRFSGSYLYRKLANISSELEYSDITNTKLLKQLTGGDAIHADRKFLSPVTFVNHAKLIFSCNAIPATHDDTAAFYRRAHIIQFPHQFPPDPSIDVKIREDSPEMTNEYEGLLYTVLEHLKKLRERNFIFDRDESIAGARSTYQYLSNPLVRFIEDYCERTRSDDDYIYKFELKDRFNEWAREAGFNTYNDQRLGRAMKELGYEEGKRGENRYRAWIGLRFRLQNIDSGQDVQDVHVFSNRETGKNNLIEKCPDIPDIPDRGAKCAQCDNQTTCMLSKGQAANCEGPFECRV